jgi:hypothetical protein
VVAVGWTADFERNPIETKLIRANQWSKRVSCVTCKNSVKKVLERALFWTPRVLCISFAAFISLFSLDLFGGGYGFLKTAQALLLHLIPA